MSINRETCYTIRCDECRTVFDEDGESVFHYSSADAAESAAVEAGWLISTDGQHVCECCWARFTCTEFGHIYTEWRPCTCNGILPDHAANGCGLWRACNRRACQYHEDTTLADLPTIDEPDRSR